MSKWVRESLANLTVFIKDGTHGSFKDNNDGIPLLSTKDILSGKVDIPEDCRKISLEDYNSIHSSYELCPADLLLTIVGTIGRSALIQKIDRKFTFQRSVAIFRLNKDKLIADYAYHFFNSNDFQSQLEKAKNASAQGGVYLGSLAKTEVLYPTSIFEQRKIGRILSCVDAVIEKTEAAIAKYKAIKQGMMQDIFTRGLDKNGKLRPRYQDAPDLYKKTELGWIPKEWEVIKISDSCTNFINGGTPSTKNLRYWIGTIPWVTGADFLESFEIGTIRRFITEDAVRNSSTHVIKGGNILLVTRTGVGKLAVAPFDIAISQDITGLILDPVIFDVKFFYYYLQLLVEMFKKMNQGTSINGIVRNDLENTLVAKPKIEEQIKVAQMISAIDIKLTTELQALNKIQKLRLALMSVLLTGKVRVKYEEDK